eukprot:15478964-Alexandrium_andersonii.AAC.1
MAIYTRARALALPHARSVHKREACSMKLYPCAAVLMRDATPDSNLSLTGGARKGTGRVHERQTTVVDTPLGTLAI